MLELNEAQKGALEWLAKEASWNKAIGRKTELVVYYNDPKMKKELEILFPGKRLILLKAEDFKAPKMTGDFYYSEDEMQNYI